MSRLAPILIAGILATSCAYATVLREQPSDGGIGQIELWQLAPTDRFQVLSEHRDIITKLDLKKSKLVDSDWKIICSLPHLRELSFGPGIALDKLEKLNECFNIKTLCFDSEKQSFEQLLKMRPLLFIEELSLRCGEVATDQRLDLSAFPNLKKLHLQIGNGSGKIDLSSLSALADTLEEISVEGSSVTNIDVIAKLRKLRRLVFSDTKLSEKDTASMAALPGLQVLVLCANNLSLDSYRNIGNIKSLTSLDLIRQETPPDAFLEIARLSNLEEFSIEDGDCSDLDIVTLSKLTKLRHLSLKTKQGFDGSTLSALSNCSKLQKLVANCSRLTEDGAKNLGQLVSLHDLAIVPCKFDSAWVKYLSKLTNLDSFEAELSKTGADQEAIGLARIPNLTCINLANSDLSDEGLAYLGRLAKLKTLRLENTAVTDKGMESLQQLKNLEELNVSGCRITDSGLIYIGKLYGLTRLDLTKTPISDLGLPKLQDLQYLKVLSLDDTKINGSGLELIAKLKLLENLGLRSTLILDKNMPTLSSSNIYSLDISDTDITEHSLPLLKQLKNLKYLDFENCGFMTSEAIPGDQREISLKLASQQNASKASSVTPKNGGSKEELERDLQTRKEMFDTTMARTHASIAIRDYDNALKDAQTAVSMNRLSAAARIDRGFVFLKKGEYDKAINDLDRAIEIDPNSGSAKYYRALVYEHFGKNDLAKADREESKRLGFVPANFVKSASTE